MTKREYVHNDFLIDSGAVTSVCQQSLVDSVGGIPRGPGVDLRSATMVSTWQVTFRLRPRILDCRRSIISVGLVCDKGGSEHL